MKSADASVFQWWNNMWNIIHFDEITSTQTYAKEHHLPLYTIVTTNHQTAGLGQYGRVWEDQNKSIMLTAVLPLPNMPVALFTQYIALNIIEQLAAYRSDIQIKWPNDLVIGRKKLGGILTEVIGDVVYVGIGINLIKPDVAIGIGLFECWSDESFQFIQSLVITAIQNPIKERHNILLKAHVYFQEGITIDGEYHDTITLTETGALQVGTSVYVDSQFFHTFYN